MLVFPGPKGKPNGHFLRVLQNLALRAGLNCGECVNKKGQSCNVKPICGDWGCTNSGRPSLLFTMKLEFQFRPCVSGLAIPI
jgi:hypothetical protein